MNQVVSKPKATILDLDALMDTKLSDVETLPDYMNPPPGIFMLTIKECGIKKYDIKDAQKKKTGEQGNRIALTYAIDSTEEVAAGEIGVPDGTLFTEGFQGTEDGLKYFKKRAMAVLNEKDFGDASLGDIFSAMTGHSFKARITIRKTEGDNGQTYENVNIQAIHG